jgi:ATP phosphoribosyltransferase regulatory subunit
VLIDLTMIGDFSYYTGMTFEGYAADLGFPVVSGGRYDNLLGQFGRPAPATGFALKTTRLLELVGLEPDGDDSAVLIGYDEAGRREALIEAGRLRDSGNTVVTERIDDGLTHSSLLAAAKPVVYKGKRYAEFLSYTGTLQEHTKGGDAT